MSRWRAYGAGLALWIGALVGLSVWMPGGALADPQVHRVRQGDTLTRIARRYGVQVREIQNANGLGRRSRLAVGQELLIPGDEPIDGQTLASMRERRARGRAAATAERLGVGTTRGAQNLLVDPPPRRWVRAAGRGRLQGTLLFPVPRGWWGRGWGSGRGGYHLAVDMPGPSGSPVRAAERGLVVYADNGVRGYGNFVMIVHPNGWVTAYAHNSRFRVTAGQKVRRGERIADLGSTGISRGPHVHFMLMHDGEHCDPTPLFRPSARHRGGRRVRAPAVRWRDRQPESIRCLPRSARPFPRGEDAVDRDEDVESGEGEDGSIASGGGSRRPAASERASTRSAASSGGDSTSGGGGDATGGAAGAGGDGAGSSPAGGGSTTTPSAAAASPSEGAAP
ncbi:MAG: M23 family metallopeptidase [Deltaproteobacteria bacterium]|nr:M23 family metallopeptidase [Deltaproteobacteria bacterium]